MTEGKKEGGRLVKRVEARKISTASLLHVGKLTPAIHDVTVTNTQVIVRCVTGEQFEFTPRQRVEVTYFNHVHAADFWEGIWIVGPYRAPIRLKNVRKGERWVEFDISGDPTGTLVGHQGKAERDEVFERVRPPEGYGA